MIINRRLKRHGITGTKFLFHVNNPKKQFLKWSEYVQLKESFSFFKKIKRNSQWKIKTRVMMKLCDILKLVKFIQLKFVD